MNYELMVLRTAIITQAGKYSLLNYLLFEQSEYPKFIIHHSSFIIYNSTLT